MENMVFHNEELFLFLKDNGLVTCFDALIMQEITTVTELLSCSEEDLLKVKVSLALRLKLQHLIEMNNNECEIISIKPKLKKVMKVDEIKSKTVEIKDSSTDHLTKEGTQMIESNKEEKGLIAVEGKFCRSCLIYTVCAFNKVKVGVIEFVLS